MKPRSIPWLEILATVTFGLIIIAMLASCGDYAQDGQVIVVVDKCEYIKSGLGGTSSLVHKANCTNAIHEWNK